MTNQMQEVQTVLACNYLVLDSKRWSTQKKIIIRLNCFSFMHQMQPTPYARASWRPHFAYVAFVLMMIALP